MHLGLPLTPGRSLTPTGFDCETDGKFKVANTVFAEGRVRNYTNAQWEAALGKAKQRTKAGEWPVITSNDF
jgi:hypothetical protein